MKPDLKSLFSGMKRPLANFWPAVLVIATVAAANPAMVPALQPIPERLVLSEAEPAAKKPALPPAAEKGTETEQAVADSGNTYTDGVYTGSSRGYGGTITVQVAVKETKIAEVLVKSAPGETGSFLSKAKKVIDRVLQAQTWEVDVVSGATYSSRGILGAIKNALTGEKVENSTPPAQPKPAAPLTTEPFDDNAVWKDGVYTGSASGFGGTIKVEVTIKGGKIAAIRVLDHSGESSSYYNKAKKVIDRILKKGTPNVDTVSGATYSSNGIINAVKNALKKAADGSGTGEEEDPGKQDPENPAKPDPQEETEDPDTKHGLKDGSYKETVVCTDGRIFDYDVRMIMTVKGGKITRIAVKKTEDRSDMPDMNKTYLGYAVSGRKTEAGTQEGVVRQILSKQTTKGVDIVSGATWSSNALLKGGRKLLAKAAKNPSSVEDPEEDDPEKDDPGKDDPEKDDPGKDDPEKDDPGKDDPGNDDQGNDPDFAGWADGTYSCDVDCTDGELFDYTLRVTTVIEDGRIASVSAGRSGDRSEDPDNNTNYIDFAKNGRVRNGVTYRGVIEQVLEKQSASGIDAVSRATYSSNAILAGVRNDLQQAADRKKAETGDDSGEGKTDDPGTGATDDPGTGSTEDPGAGKTDDPGTGATDDPGTGTTDGPGTGTTDDSGEGKTDDPGNGTTDDPGAGKTDDPGTGLTDDSGAGKTDGSESGKTDDAGSGRMEESGSGKTGGSGSGNTENAGIGKTDDSSSGKTEGSGSGKTDDSGSGNTENAGTGKTDDSGSEKTEGSESGKTDDSGSGKTDGSETGSTQEEDGRYKNGKYTATAHCRDDDDDPCFDYRIKVTVTIEGGKIKSVKAEKKDDESEYPEDNEIYMNWAANGRKKNGKTLPGIPRQVTDAQKASGLDAVSGATYSSRAMIKAVKEALEDAEK